MASWGEQGNSAANSTLYAPAYVNLTANATNEANLFGNTTPGAFKGASGAARNGAVGVFGVTTTARNAANASSENKKVGHTGWNLRRVGVGPILSITASPGGTGYNNTDVVKVSGGTVNALGNPVTNTTGGILSVTLTNNGSGLSKGGTTTSVANSTGGASAGSGATFAVTVGGRGNRVTYECLVAMSGSMVGAGSTLLPNT